MKTIKIIRREKFEQLLMILIFLSLSFGSCKKDKIDEDFYGYWNFEYKLNEDGSKDYNNPYALLEFTYCDAFRLCKNKTGYTDWYFDNPPSSCSKCDSPEFDWEIIDNNILKLFIENSGGTIREFDFEIKKYSDVTMYMKSPKGYEYILSKIE